MTHPAGGVDRHERGGPCGGRRKAQEGNIRPGCEGADRPARPPPHHHGKHQPHPGSDYADMQSRYRQKMSQAGGSEERAEIRVQVFPATQHQCIDKGGTCSVELVNAPGKPVSHTKAKWDVKTGKLPDVSHAHPALGVNGPHHDNRGAAG